MHRNAKRAMLFTTGKLRSIRRRANLRRMMRQEVAVDVHHLRRTRKPHQQQTGSSQHPQPQGVRGCISSALESFRQEVQVSVAARNSRATSSMTHSTEKWTHDSLSASSERVVILSHRALLCETPLPPRTLRQSLRLTPLSTPSSTPAQSQTNPPPHPHPRSQKSAPPHLY